jgi:hypothetical protein
VTFDRQTQFRRFVFPTIKPLRPRGRFGLDRNPFPVREQQRRNFSTRFPNETREPPAGAKLACSQRPVGPDVREWLELDRRRRQESDAASARPRRSSASASFFKIRPGNRDRDRAQFRHSATNFHTRSNSWARRPPLQRNNRDRS